MMTPANQLKTLRPLLHLTRHRFQISDIAVVCLRHLSFIFIVLLVYCTSKSVRVVLAEQPWTVDDLLDEDNQSDRVPLQRLQQLGESKALMNLLQNPHLRQVMMEVDSAQDKDKAMKKAMQEPLFVEFADQCLQIMEPTEKVEETDDGY